jgi:hypothetical protein
MNLKELVHLSNNIENISFDDLQEALQNRVARMMSQSDIPDAGVDPGYRDRLQQKSQTLKTVVESIDQELTDLKKVVQQGIEELGHDWMVRTYAKYENHINTRYAQKPEYLLLHQHKSPQLTDEKATELRTRVSSYSDWRHPAMVIHPWQEPFIQDMVASDPLYLVDETYLLLNPVLEQFNDLYQNRLRVYAIEETFDQPILAQLPDQQFGFVLVYNYLDYRPFEFVKRYMSEIYEKLRPGGVLAMTFNDCDRFKALQGVEQGITGYTPGRLVRAWARYLGFEEVYTTSACVPSVWIEFQKPGELTTLRGGQSLAKILPKPVA